MYPKDVKNVIITLRLSQRDLDLIAEVRETFHIHRGFILREGLNRYWKPKLREKEATLKQLSLEQQEAILVKEEAIERPKFKTLMTRKPKAEIESEPLDKNIPDDFDIVSVSYDD